MYIALTTLQIRRLLLDDVVSANVCIVRCSIYSCAPGIVKYIIFYKSHFVLLRYVLILKNKAYDTSGHYKYRIYHTYEEDIRGAYPPRRCGISDLYHVTAAL